MNSDHDRTPQRVSRPRRASPTVVLIATESEIPLRARSWLAAEPMRYAAKANPFFNFHRHKRQNRNHSDA